VFIVFHLVPAAAALPTPGSGGNPQTGIPGNAELLLAEIRRKGDGKLPHCAPQRVGGSSLLGNAGQEFGW